MKERKIEPPRPHAHQSPVLFLVTSHMLPNMNRTNAGSALDKPPSYDTIVSLDGLPPDYSSVQLEKPPRYEEVAALYKAARNSEYASQDATPGPSGLARFQKADQACEGTSSGKEVLNKRPKLADACETEQSAEDIDCIQAICTGDDINAVASGTSASNIDNGDSTDDVIENQSRAGNSMNLHVQNTELENSEHRGTKLPTLQPKRSSLSLSFRTRRDVQKQNRDRKRNASGNDSGNSEAKVDSSLSSTKSLLRLQVPTLHQDTAGRASKYLECQDTASTTLPSVHSSRFSSTRSGTLPNTSAGCRILPSGSEFDITSVARSKVQDQRDDVTVHATEVCSSENRQLSHSSSKV